MAQPHQQNRRPGERNALLLDLDDGVYSAIAQHLDEVTLKAGQVLVDANELPTHVFFPQSAVVSHVALFNGGGAVEVGTVGCEGMSGIPVFLGVDTSPHRTILQIEGALRRMPADAFRNAVEEHPSLDEALSHYVDAYLLQVSQTAACNRMHDLGQRAARWLLMTHDRVGNDTFALTHEFLAVMLGVRRAGVSEAAADLQRKGAITYSRGKVTVADRAVLEQQSCECYQVVRDRFDTKTAGVTAGAGQLSTG